MATGDFNGDGHLDLIISGGGGVLLLGSGDGTFQAPRRLSLPNGSLTAGDLNGDG